MRDEQQQAWRESWAGWDEIPQGRAWEQGYNALHDQSGGFGRLSTPSPEWADGVPHRFWDDEVVHRFWDDEVVQAEADAWGPRWDDRWADDEGGSW